MFRRLIVFAASLCLGLALVAGSAAAKAMQTSAARKLVPIAKRILPAKVAREAKGRALKHLELGEDYPGNAEAELGL
jgi:hypothetical protein